MKEDLSGQWEVNLENIGAVCPPQSYPDRITLPGTTSFAGLGRENSQIEKGHLTDMHPFRGTAWYRRKVSGLSCPETWNAYLFLERTRKTKVYFDGIFVGENDSLCTPHIYTLPRFTQGQHTLIIGVDNETLPVPGGHMTSPDTQSNWNGITGEISLVFSPFYPANLSVFPDRSGSSIRICADMLGACEGEADASIIGQADFRVRWTNHRLDFTCTLPFRAERWDALHPSVYTLALFSDNTVWKKDFGFRTLSRRQRTLSVNGLQVFLRGKTESLIFPKTGYAPTDCASWHTYLQTVKAYGINHLRCHTCCPPEAAFAAADRTGIYLEPELPFWGTLHDSADQKYISEGQQYLFEEGVRILKAFGSHPSFVLFSLGNELWGSRKTMTEWIRSYRALRPDILYLSGSNNFFVSPSVHPDEDVFSGVRLGKDRLLRGSFAMCDAPLGRIQTEAPHTDWDYDKCILPEHDRQTENDPVSREVMVQVETGVRAVQQQTQETAIPQVPILSHEVGQYCFYPCFDEEMKYTGPLKAKYLIPMAARLKKAGLYADWKRFFSAAGKLSAACYRAEIEAALRSRELSGFQLLALQDFAGQGIALVGILNVFMENKGICPPDVWRRFCADTVILARLPGFVYQSEERLRFSVQISSSCRQRDHAVQCCLYAADDACIARQDILIPRADGRLSPEVPAVFTLPKADKPERCRLRLSLENGIWTEYAIDLLPVYENLRISPEGIRTKDAFIRFVSSPEAARLTTEKAIVVPPAGQSLPAEYAPDFWCYSMFRSISQKMGKPEPVGTMGLSIDKSHPLLRLFPTDDYTTPVWYPVLRHAHCEPVDPDCMIAEMIDNPYRCQRLGILYIKDGFLHLTSRLWEAENDPCIRALAFSLVNGLRECCL